MLRNSAISACLFTLLACEAPTREIDAGVGDASVATDAGRPRDAGFADAGASDAGASDAGTPRDAGARDAGSSIGTIAIDRWVDTVARATCDALFACCTDIRVLDSFGGSVDDCTIQFVSFRQYAAESGLDDLLDSGVTVLNEERLAQCRADLDALAAGSCTRPPLSQLYLCLGAFEGTLPPGASCGALPQDLGFMECRDGSCHQGRCLELLPSGATCDPSNDADNFCNVFAGEACADDGLSTPTCRPFQAPGAACVSHPNTFDYQCESLVCEAGQCRAPTGQELCQEGN
ncbi:MAG: hypothetical protein RMA76_26920 [Deltaproteobacteria bacterium]|jgi:hypothetical protein